MTQAVDQTMLVELMTAGLQPELIARAGSAAVKLDWSATWRNWCRNTAEKFGRPRPSASTPCAKRMVFVSAEDPAFAAWERQSGRRLPKNKNNGWYFDSHWPPQQQEGEAT